AQAITGATPEAFRGNSFWRCAPHLVSTALYQAVRKTRQTRTLIEAEYVSPVTQSWLHVHLAPTVGGLILHFHEVSEPARSPETFPQGERLSIEDLDGLQTRIGILTPEGIVLDINEVPLDAAQVRREEVIGKPLAETPWWSFAPASQEQLRAAIARANTGETARFEALLRPREGMLLSFESAITPHLDADHHIEYLVLAGIDITARKQAERDIHALIDAIPQLVWTGRPDGYIDYYNQRWRDYTGLSTEQAQGDGWMQCTHPDDRQRVLAVWQSAVQTGTPYETEQRLRQGTTGAYRWFLMQATPYTDAQGTILKYVGTCTDIDDKKQAEEERRALIDAIPQFVWIMGPDGSCDYCNQPWCDYTNMTPEQIQGDGWIACLHPDDRQRTLDAWQTAVRTQTLYEVEYRMQQGRTGDYRWFLARGMPRKDSQGTILQWFGTCTDIDEQKRAEQQLKTSEENWRVLAETVPQLVWTIRADGLSDYFNQRFCDYTHATCEQLYGYGWSQFVHPEDYERTLAARAHAFRTGTHYEVAYRFREGQTDRYRWFLARAMPVRDGTGQIIKWFGTCTDIDEQKQVEQKIKESEENWRVLAETVPQFVWIERPDGSVEYLNHRYIDYLQARPEQLQSDGWSLFLHADDYQRALAAWRHALETGEPHEIEYRLKDGQTGTYRWFLARAMPVRDDTGQIVKWFGTTTDIENQKRMEEALRQSQERAGVLMNSNIIGIFASEDEQVVDANDTYLRMTGYTREDLREWRINWLNMTPPEYLARTQQARKELVVQRYGTPYEKEYLCKDGSRLPVVVGVVALKLDPLYTIGFVLDNSARKELEQRKDAFISMASHELKTPLTALKL
ncbi:MAG TPA: PAS domain S-box protein, partial [Ktedonobacteraceae bacterium]|nr:PAS domain S-box protein [Ktedonobacteraceae bacterium]